MFASVSVMLLFLHRFHVIRAYKCDLYIKKKYTTKESSSIVSKIAFNSLKEECEKRKKLICGIMLSINIFFVVIVCARSFKNYIVRDKRVIVLNAGNGVLIFTIILCLSPSLYKLENNLLLQKLIYSMEN